MTSIGLLTRRPRALRQRIAVILACSAAVLVLPAVLFGHAVVYPKASTTGAHEKYVLRVPNEKAVATTRVEIRFPAEIKVSSFAEVPGWQLEVVTDSAKRIVGAIWTGSLPAHRFAEFSFVGTNPKAVTTLTWATFQTYDGGERVEWTGAPGTKSPASVTTISEPASATAAGPSPWVAWSALVVAVVSLGLSLRPRAA